MILKVRVLRLIPPLDLKNSIIGQYSRSQDGEKPGYKDDDSVPEGSRCPTFCVTIAYIKSARWDGVPFILKAGKGLLQPKLWSTIFADSFAALNESKTEIRIQFKDTTAAAFSNTKHNELIIRIQPNEGLHLMMNSKLPALSTKTVYTDLDLTYRGLDHDAHMPEAYESLILDALKGDHSLSVRREELDASWKIFTPLLHYLEEHNEVVPEEYLYGKLPFQIPARVVRLYILRLDLTSVGSTGPPDLDKFISSYQYNH